MRYQAKRNCQHYRYS